MSTNTLSGTGGSPFTEVAVTGTAADSIDTAGGIEAGSGNVALVGIDGKINGPLSSTIIDDLSAANLTAIPGGQITGAIAAVSGANLTTLNGSNISSGTVASARLTGQAATNLSSGTVATARLGSGTASSSTFLRGDSSWQTVTSFDPDGAVTINDTGADVDFRVETSGQANMLFADGGEDRIGIGTATPAQTLHIDRTAGAYLLISRIDTGSSFTDGNTLGALQFGGQDADSNWEPLASHIFAKAAGAWTSSSHPSRMEFSTGFTGSVDIATRMSVTEHGLTFGTDTAAANALDDYEEGTWSPVPKGTTGSAGSHTHSMGGNYTKIGRMVTVTAYGVMTDKGSWTGSARVTGLPFTVGGNAVGHSGASNGYIGLYPAGEVDAAWRTAHVPTGTDHFTFQKGLKMDYQEDYTDWDTGAYLTVTASYWVD